MGEADSWAALERRTETETWNLIVLNVRLGDGNSIELLPQLKAKFSKPMPVMGFSASVLKNEVAEALAASFDDFLSKPVREEDLFARIGRLLRIEWTGEIVERSDAADPAGQVGAICLSPQSLAELREAANTGNAKRLKEQLAVIVETELDGKRFARILQPLLSAYRMGDIRQCISELEATAKE